MSGGHGSGDAGSASGSAMQAEVIGRCSTKIITYIRNMVKKSLLFFPPPPTRIQRVYDLINSVKISKKISKKNNSVNKVNFKINLLITNYQLPVYVYTIIINQSNSLNFDYFTIIDRLYRL